MEKIDLKTADVTVRNELRRLTCRLRSKGRTYPEIADEYGVSYSTVPNYCTSDQKKEKVRGRHPVAK